MNLYVNNPKEIEVNSTGKWEKKTVDEWKQFQPIDQVAAQWFDDPVDNRSIEELPNPVHGKVILTWQSFRYTSVDKKDLYFKDDTGKYFSLESPEYKQKKIADSKQKLDEVQRLKLIYENQKNEQLEKWQSSYKNSKLTEIDESTKKKYASEYEYICSELSNKIDSFNTYTQEVEKATLALQKLSSGGAYYEKYLKYKNKYSELKNNI
jgi:hypothetical protein